MKIAVAAADKVFLISSSEVGQRAQQHMRVIAASRGDLDGSSADMRRLIGRPTTRLADAVAAALGARK